LSDIVDLRVRWCIHHVTLPLSVLQLLLPTLSITLTFHKLVNSSNNSQNFIKIYYRLFDSSRRARPQDIMLAKCKFQAITSPPNELSQPIEGSGHKSSKTNYFRFGHFYITIKVSTSPTRWCYPFCDWPIHFRAKSSAKKLLKDVVLNVACTNELRNSASTMVLNRYELERLLRNS